MVTFLPQSHMRNDMDGFEYDHESIGDIVEELEAIGIKRHDIGLLGICYGAGVSAQYLEKEDVGFAIYIEPFLGIKSLGVVTRGAYKAVKGIFSNPLTKKLDILNRLPYTRRLDRGKSRINVDSFARFMEKEVKPNKNVPTLSIVTRFHTFFDHEYSREWVDATGGITVEKKLNEKDCLVEMDDIFMEFIQNYN